MRRLIASALSASQSSTNCSTSCTHLCSHCPLCKHNKALFSCANRRSTTSSVTAQSPLGRDNCSQSHSRCSASSAGRVKYSEAVMEAAADRPATFRLDTTNNRACDPSESARCRNFRKMTRNDKSDCHNGSFSSEGCSVDSIDSSKFNLLLATILRDLSAGEWSTSLVTSAMPTALLFNGEGHCLLG